MPGCDRMILFRFHDVNMVGRLMDIPFQNGLRSFFLHKNNRVHLNGLFYSSFGFAQCLFELRKGEALVKEVIEESSP